jgi:SAM-dependent methyltransferase
MSPTRKPDICQPTGTAELPMLDVYMPMMKSAAIVSAARMGLFEALADGALEVDVLAGRLAADAQGTRTLADFLVALGYLTKSAARYANTDSTQRWFTRAGQIDYTPGVLWTHEAWAMMGDLSSAVTAGTPQRSLWDTMRDKPHLGPLFSRYMQAFAQDLGPDLIAHVPVTDRHTRLLDLGGSHGLHSIRFCQHYRQLNAVIVDMPSALTDTAQTAAQEGLSDRISLHPANLLDLDWIQPCDIVLYLSVGHNQHESDNRRVLAEIAQSLRPGGLLVIHDYLADDPLNAFHAAFRLTLLYETGTRTYSDEEYRGWLREAGFSSVSRIDLNPLEKGSLLLAWR